MAACGNVELNVDESLKGLFEEQSDHQMNGGDESRMINGDDGGEGFKQDMRGLDKMMSKLNPMAQEFVPCLVAADGHTLVPANSPVAAAGDSATLKKGGSSHREQKGKGKAARNQAQRNEVTKTVYVYDIDNQITEEQLAALFATCGKLVDCVICGSPESVLRSALVEFTDEESARNTLSLAGTMLGSHTIRVLLLKTEIPVQPTLFPSKKSGSSHREQRVKGKASNQTSSPQRKQVRRTVYVYNIDNQITEDQLAALFATCGQLVDCCICASPKSVRRFAFVEFTDQESAGNALSLAGTMLGSHTIRVLPSKTAIAPVKPLLLPSKKSGSSHRKRKAKGKASNEISSAERQVRRTVYVSDIDNQITEDQLAALFTSCGQLVDSRICGTTDSVLRCAFVEFTNEESARNALSLAGTMLGSHTIRVLPSKTAIAPVDPKLLPRSEDERERCTRTIYCTNIHKKFTPEDVELFFESFCGEVLCLRLFEDRDHSTHTALVEFAASESAIAALHCSGVVFGHLTIRVSPSKTPIRQGVTPGRRAVR